MLFRFPFPGGCLCCVYYPSEPLDSVVLGVEMFLGMGGSEGGAWWWGEVGRWGIYWSGPQCRDGTNVLCIL